MASKSEMVRKAMRDYDNDYPDNDYPGTGHKSWLENENYSWALDDEGRLYPPKKIWSLVTTEETPKFNTEDAKRELRDAGFRIIPKPGATRQRKTS